jgi:multisubunit Na+/H+ antiporter MnhC subunit
VKDDSHKKFLAEVALSYAEDVKLEEHVRGILTHAYILNSIVLGFLLRQVLVPDPMSIYLKIFMGALVLTTVVINGVSMTVAARYFKARIKKILEMRTVVLTAKDM